MGWIKISGAITNDSWRGAAFVANRSKVQHKEMDLMPNALRKAKSRFGLPAVFTVFGLIAAVAYKATAHAD